MSGKGWGARLLTAAAVLAALYLAVGGIASQLAGRTVLADTDYMMRYGAYANAGYGESQSKNLMQSDIYTSEIPAEDLIGILMTNQSWTSPTPPLVCNDFWACAYAAIDD